MSATTAQVYCLEIVNTSRVLFLMPAIFGILPSLKKFSHTNLELRPFYSQKSLKNSNSCTQTCMWSLNRAIFLIFSFIFLSQLNTRSSSHFLLLTAFLSRDSLISHFSQSKNILIIEFSTRRYFPAISPLEIIIFEFPCGPSPLYIPKDTVISDRIHISAKRVQRE